MKTAEKPRIGLVYPPYGPPNLPNLGLAILSAGLKERGFDCRTFFWHYRFVWTYFPGTTMAEKLKFYDSFTRRDLFPWNEWMFTRCVLQDELQHRDDEVLERLARLDESALLAGNPTPVVPSRFILGLCNQIPQALATFAAELLPYDIIGITTTFHQNGPALALAKFVKDMWPEKVTVLGGANCDGDMGRALFDHFPFLDYVFSGEVDHAFPEFVERWTAGEPLDEVPGMMRRGPSGETLAGPPALPLTDLDSLPIPDFDDYVRERRLFGLLDDGKLVLPLESSRGCWWGAKSHCKFCGLNANGMAYRQKSPERFQREVEAVVARYNTRYFFMADNILSTKYFNTFVKWAQERGLDVDFFYEIKANMRRRQVEELADAGITMVQPGVESFSSKTLELMGKGLRGIQNVAFLKFARDNGMILAYNILAGFPGEDPGEYARVAAEVPKLSHLAPPNGVGQIEFQRFSPYFDQSDDFGLRLKPLPDYSFVYPVDDNGLTELAFVFEAEGGRRNGELSYIEPLVRAIQSWRQGYDTFQCTLTWEADGEDGLLVRDRRLGFTPRNYRLRDFAVAVYHALDHPSTLAVAGRDAAQRARRAADGNGNGNGNGRPAASPDGAALLAQQQLAAAGMWGYAPAAWGQAFQHHPQDLVEETTISFTEEEYNHDPAGCLAELVTAGIIYEEDDRYLTLPVNASHRRVEEGWGNVGI